MCVWMNKSEAMEDCIQIYIIQWNEAVYPSQVLIECLLSVSMLCYLKLIWWYFTYLHVLDIIRPIALQTQ